MPQIMNEERRDRMRRAMEAARLDALVVRLPENVLLLSGFWPMIGASTVVFPRESPAAICIPDCFEQEAQQAIESADPTYFRFGVLNAPPPMEALRNFLVGAARGKAWKRIGYEANFALMAPSWQSGEILMPTEQLRELYRGAFSGAELVDASPLIQSERRRKTAHEAAKMRIASEISCIGMEAFEAMVDIGRSGIELVAAVESAITVKGVGYKGAQRVRSYAQVATGARETAIGNRMNEIFTTRKLGHGDLALLELGVVADGYWADRTRVRVAGEPTEEQVKVFETVRKAQQTACAAIRPGATGAEVDEAARSIIRDAGYGEHFPHITGHGLGFGYHESAPRLAPGSADRLEEGILTSVEPGIYFEPVGGIRIEDDVLVTSEGSEILGAFRKELK
jgi:Xaa-Pro dipeptidase